MPQRRRGQNNVTTAKLGVSYTPVSIYISCSINTAVVFTFEGRVIKTHIIYTRYILQSGQDTC